MNTQESGMSLFESLVILSVVQEIPGNTKGNVARAVRENMGMDVCENTMILHMIDNLVRTGLLVRLDFKFYVTPAGEKYFEENRARFMPAIKRLVFR
jgi:hypothetical protein